jgi:hypothetical protein
MNELAVVCPHCNARRAGATAGLRGKALSPQEIRALVLTDVMLARPPAQGLLSALILPHPSTTGSARTAEIVLTFLSFPLVIAGALSLAISRRKTRRTYDEVRGELSSVIAMLGLGGLGLTSLLSIAGASLATNVVITGISVAALIGRAVIRSRAARERSRALLT